MYEYIKKQYGRLFTASDLPAFVAAGWLTRAQAAELGGVDV